MFGIKFSFALKQTCTSLDIFAFAIGQDRMFLSSPHGWVYCVLQRMIWLTD